MHRISIYAHYQSCLSVMVAEQGVRHLNGYASVILASGVTKDTYRVTMQTLAAQGWANKQSQTTRHLKFQVKPHVYQHLQKLANDLGLSVSRSALVVFEHAAQQLQNARAASCALPKVSEQPLSVSQSYVTYRI